MNFSIKNIVQVFVMSMVISYSEFAITSQSVYYPKYEILPGSVNLNCDEYVIKNSYSVYSNFNQLHKFYIKNKWSDLKKLKIELMIGEYLVNLFECMTLYSFQGDVDYFYEVHSKIFLLNHIYSRSIDQKKHSRADVVSLYVEVREYMIKIENAKKIKERGQKEK